MLWNSTCFLSRAVVVPIPPGGTVSHVWKAITKANTHPHRDPLLPTLTNDLAHALRLDARRVHDARDALHERGVQVIPPRECGELRARAHLLAPLEQVEEVLRKNFVMC